MKKATLLISGLLLSQIAGTALAETKKTAPAKTLPATEATAPAAASSLTGVEGPVNSTTVSFDTVKADSDKKWSFLGLLSASSDSLVKKPGSDEKTEVSAQHLIDLGYKVGEKSKVSLRQYFNTNYDSEQQSSANISQDGLNPTAILFNTPASDGILGSSEVSATFWYYLPVNQVDYDTRSNGTLRVDFQPKWDLGSGFKFNWYLSPRVEFVPEGIVESSRKPIMNAANQVVGSEYTMKIPNYTLRQGPGLSYSINDNVSFYGYTWLQHYFQASNANLLKVRNLYEVGAEFSINDNFTINPLISGDVTMANTKFVNGERTFGSQGDNSEFMASRPDELNYEIDLVVVF